MEEQPERLEGSQESTMWQTPREERVRSGGVVGGMRCLVRKDQRTSTELATRGH